MVKKVVNSVFLLLGGAFAAVLLAAFFAPDPARAGTLDEPRGFPQVMDLTLNLIPIQALRWD